MTIRETTMVAVQTNGKAPTAADLLTQIEALKAENAKLKQAQTARISFKVSEKGGVVCTVWDGFRSRCTPGIGNGCSA